MKKALLIFSVMASLWFQETDAQTLTYESLPNNVAIGATAEFTLNYTSTVPCKVEASLFIFDIDGDGVLTQDWSTWQAGQIVSDLPAAATATSQVVSFAVPSSAVPSSELPAGKTYVWTLSLKDAADGWITGEQMATNIVAVTGIANGIEYVGTPAAEVNAGTTVQIEYSYSLAAAGKVKVALSRYNAEHGWEADIANFIINDAPATTEAVSGIADIVIPADTPLSADLEEGYSYQWEIAVYDPDWSYFTGVKSPVEVTALAGLDKHIVKAVAVYPNPVKDRLNISVAVAIEKTEVFDMTGKLLLSAGNTESIDVSSLAGGIYFIRVNNNNTVKFVKE